MRITWKRNRLQNNLCVFFLVLICVKTLISWKRSLFWSHFLSWAMRWAMVIDCFRSGCVPLCHCLDMVTICLPSWMMCVLFQIHYSYCESSHCNQVQIDGKNYFCEYEMFLEYSIFCLAICRSQITILPSVIFCPLLFPCTDDDTGLQSLPGELPVVAASCTSAPSLSHLTSSSWVICTLQCMLLF